MFFSKDSSMRFKKLRVVHLGEIAEDLVALGVEDHEALIKVVVLHGGGGVQGGQAVARLDLLIVRKEKVREVQTST
jgi:hypothetical protein